MDCSIYLLVCRWYKVNSLRSVLTILNSYYQNLLIKVKATIAGYYKGMPLQYAHAACMHHEVVEQHSMLRYTPPTLSHMLQKPA